MSMNEPRRGPGGDGRDRDRFERRPPFYHYPYPYQRPYPYYSQPYPYQYPYPQPYPYTQPYPYAQPYPYTQPAPVAPQPQPQPGTCPQGAMPYSVQEGDTLENISSRLGVTPDQVVNANPGVNFSVPLRTGQSVCLPIGEEQQ